MSEKIEPGQVLLKLYDDFLSFVGKKIDKQARLELLLDGFECEWISVQNLLDVLKQKSKFLSKDEFINLVSGKKLRMGHPYRHSGTPGSMEACDRAIRFIQQIRMTR